MTQRRFEDDLPTFLRTLADDVAPRDDASAAVVRRIGQRPPPRRPLTFAVPVAAIAAVVVVGLLAVLLTHHPSPAFTPTSCIGANPPGLACPVTDQGITIQPLQARADAYSTTVQVVIAGSKDTVYDPVLLDPMLTDERGRIYFSTLDSYEDGKVPQHVTAHLSFTPLSPTDLAQPQTLTLTITRIKPTNGAPDMYTAPDRPPLDGRWQTRFTIKPILSKRYPVQMAPVMQQGIGLQVQSLEVAPQTDGTVGIRILLSMSGVPTNTAPRTFENWYPTDNFICNGSVEACKTSTHPPVAHLTLPGWHGGTINNPISQIVYPPKLDPTKVLDVGGTIEVELLYAGTGMATSGIATLHLTDFRLRKPGNPAPIVGAAFPAWDVSFALK